MLNNLLQNNVMDLNLNEFLNIEISKSIYKNLKYFFIIKNIFKSLYFIHEYNFSLNGEFSLNNLLFDVRNFVILYYLINYTKINCCLYFRMNINRF